MGEIFNCLCKCCLESTDATIDYETFDQQQERQRRYIVLGDEHNPHFGNVDL
jgi:hypothetical protein